MSPRFSQSFLALIALLAGLSTVGCDPETGIGSGQGCSTGVAQILVTDGGLQRLCGCAETDTALAPPPSSLTCSVAAGTVVFFQYLSTQNTHQIVSTGTPAFEDSPLSEALSETRVPVHAVKFVTTGTYTFRDVFVAGANGQIVVF